MNAKEFLVEYNKVCEHISDEIARLQKELETLPGGEQEALQELVGAAPIGCLYLSTSPAGEAVRDKHHMALLTFPMGGDHDTALSPNAIFLARLFSGMEPQKVLAVIETVMVSSVWGIKADPVGLGARVAMRILENAHAVAQIRSKEMEAMIRKHLESQKAAQDAEVKPPEEKG